MYEPGVTGGGSAADGGRGGHDEPPDPTEPTPGGLSGEGFAKSPIIAHRHVSRAWGQGLEF